MQNPQSRTQSGRKFSAHEVLVSFVEELSPDVWAFHNEVAIDDEVGWHIEAMIEKMAPSDVRSAMEIPEFRKAIDKEVSSRIACQAAVMAFQRSMVFLYSFLLL